MRRLLLLLALLAGCGEDETALPDPVRLTAEAVGHYCRMTVLDHAGPKSQIHLDGYPEPLFFVQVRDALVYAKGPEREAELRAFYVSDMGAAPSWEAPGADNWVLARDARFVVGADVRGGMGASEIVPFASADAAARFAERHGGAVLALADIPDAAFLSPAEIDLASGGRQ